MVRTALEYVYQGPHYKLARKIQEVRRLELYLRSMEGFELVEQEKLRAVFPAQLSHQLLEHLSRRQSKVVETAVKRASWLICSQRMSAGE